MTTWTHPTYPGTDQPILIGDTARNTDTGEIGRIVGMRNNTLVTCYQMDPDGTTTGEVRRSWKVADLEYFQPKVTVTVELDQDLVDLLLTCNIDAVRANLNSYNYTMTARILGAVHAAV